MLTTLPRPLVWVTTDEKGVISAGYEAPGHESLTLEPDIEFECIGAQDCLPGGRHRIRTIQANQEDLLVTMHNGLTTAGSRLYGAFCARRVRIAPWQIGADGISVRGIYESI